MDKFIQLLCIVGFSAAAFCCGQIYERHTSQAYVFGVPVEEIDDKNDSAEMIIRRPDGTMIAAEIVPESGITNMVHGAVNKFTINGRGVILGVEPRADITITVQPEHQ